jgi:hypothetical protein
MKNIATVMLATAFAATAHAAPADELKAAATKLADATSYSWTTTMEIANSQFNIGPAEGETEKGGYTVVTRTFNDNTVQSVRKGDQLVMQSPQSGEWMTAEEMRQQSGGRGFAGRGGPVNPAEEVAALSDATKGLTAAGGVISGDLTDEALARRLSFGRGGDQGNPPPAPKNAMGTVKFWVQDGALVKYEVHVKGTVTGRDGQEMDRDVTTTTVIKDLGTTKVAVPAEALKKLGAAAPAG